MSTKTPQQVVRDAFANTPLGTHTSGSVSALGTITPPTDAAIWQFQALTQNMRYMLNGAPTTSTGFQFKAGDPPRSIGVRDISAIKVIAETGTVNLEYTFFGA